MKAALSRAGKTNPGPTGCGTLYRAFFGVLGGIIGYVAFKGENPEIARRPLIIGLIMAAVTAVLYAALVAIAALAIRDTGDGREGGMGWLHVTLLAAASLHSERHQKPRHLQPS